MQPRLALPFCFFFLHLLSARIIGAYHNRPCLCDMKIKPKALECVGKPSTNWDVWVGRVFITILQIQKPGGMAVKSFTRTVCVVIIRCLFQPGPHNSRDLFTTVLKMSRFTHAKKKMSELFQGACLPLALAAAPRIFSPVTHRQAG